MVKRSIRASQFILATPKQRIFNIEIEYRVGKKLLSETEKEVLIEAPVRLVGAAAAG
jgi:hypothetical protein